MKFSVGYNFTKREELTNEIKSYKEKISEVYFSFASFPNGRNIFIENNGNLNWEITANQIEDLKKFSSMGIKCNLLLNANCYGKDSQSRNFFTAIGDTVDYLSRVCNLNCVTTTSPLIAKFLKSNFEDIEVRASVNMGIESIEGMDYVAEYFDSYYLKREYNRDIKELKRARDWCDKNDKKLYGLANSGCLNFCSTHTFHDNLVAHEHEIVAMDNAYDFEGQCWRYLKNPDKNSEWLRITNFIRPEDIRKYEGIFDGMKLATRVSKNPAGILRAYCSGTYSGNLPDLLEPNHAGLFYPQIIENKKIPDSFLEKVLYCDKNCNECVFCNEVQKNAIVNL